MTDQTPLDLGWIPQACTLPTARQPLRVAEFDELFSTAAASGQRLGPQHLRLTLTGGPDLPDMVRDLAEREAQCCSFFTFAVRTPQPGVVELDVEVPSGHIDVLDALEVRAATVGNRP